MHCGGLTCTVGADKTKYMTAPHLQVQTVECAYDTLPGPELNRQSDYFDSRFHRDAWDHMVSQLPAQEF